MRSKNGNRLVFSIVGVLVVLGAGYFLLGQRTSKMPETIEVQLAYPVTSLNPTYSKDWQTVYISNHIYPRLVPSEHEPTIPYITDNVEFTCEVPKGNPVDETCNEVRIAFTPKEFKDCMGRTVSVADIKKEFETAIVKMPWMLPKWRWCDDAPDKVCAIGKYRIDVQRRLYSVAFRFGWSKKEDGDPIFGAGPYCLKANEKSERGIVDGLLTPREGYPQLPKIHFLVTQDPKHKFHFALYGSKKLLMGERQNVQAHTPIGYYVVSHPKHDGRNLPWNHKDTRDLINETFMREEVFFSAAANITKIFPAGNAVTTSKGSYYAKKPLEFVLPDYLPACLELASKLNKKWEKFGKAKAVCKDVVSFVYERVWHPSKNWDGFIVGVTQQDPGRNTVEYEYFYPDSPESWTYDFPKPKKLYYLAGVGQSIVTVDGTNVCGLKPNLFGLGDVFVTDLLPCKGSLVGE